MSVFQDIQVSSEHANEEEEEEEENEDLQLICDINLSSEELENEEDGEEKEDKMPDLQKDDTPQISNQSPFALQRGNTIFPDVHWNTATYQQRNQLRLISLLSYEVGFRKTNQIDAITGLTQDIAFFKNLHDHELHRRCAQCMKYESFPAGSMIFKIGSIGWKFYIIIEGSVGVYLRSIQDSSGNVVSTVVDPTEKYGNLVGGLQYLKQLSTGDSFGELALMERRPRQASIVAHTDLHVGVIEKNDFQLILRTHEENKQQQMARFFDNISPFSKWNFRRQVSLHLNSIRQEFKINQIVYRQDAKVSAFYIIKSGTFAVIKELTMNKKDRKLISHRKKERLESQKKEEEQGRKRGGRDVTVDKEMKDIKTKKKQANKEDVTKVIIQDGMEDEDDGDEKSKVKDIQLMKRNTQGIVGIKLSELQEYGYFGDEEITEKVPVRQFTVICTSAHAEVLVIQKKDFELRVLSDAISCQFFVNKSQLRGKRHNNSLDSSESQLKVFKDYVCQTSSYFCRAEIKMNPRCMSTREAVIAKTLVKGNYFESEYAKKEQQQRVANEQHNEDLKGIQIQDWMQNERQNQQKEKGQTEQQQVAQPEEVVVYQKHNTMNVNNTDGNTLVDRIRARTPDGLLVSLQRHYTLDDELIPYQIKEAMQNSIISRVNSIISVSHKQRLHSQSSSLQAQSSMETPKNTNNSLDTLQSASPSQSIGGFWLPRRKTVSSAASTPNGNAHSAKRLIPGTIIKKKEWVSKYTASFQENLRKNLHEKFKDSSKLNAAAIKKHLKQTAISSIPNDHLSQPPPALANKKPVMMAPEMDQKLKLFKRIAIQTLNTCKRNTSGPNVRVDIKDIAEELQKKIKQKKINDIKDKFMEIMNTRKKKGGEDRKRVDGEVGGNNEEIQVELVKSKFMSVLAGKREKQKKMEEESAVVTVVEGCEEQDQIKEQLQPVKNIEIQNSEESQYMSTLPDSPGINGLDSVREDSLKVNEEGITEEEGEDWQLQSSNSPRSSNGNGSFELFSPCLLRNSVSQIYNANEGGSDDNSNQSSQSQQPSEDPWMKQPIKPTDSPKSHWHRFRKISQSSMFSPKSSQLRENLQKELQIPQISPSKQRKTTVSLHASSKNKVDSDYYDGMLIRKHLENKEFFCLLKEGSDIEQLKAQDNEGLKRAFLSCELNPFILANNRNGEYDSLKEDQITTKEQEYKEYPSVDGRRPATTGSKTQQYRSQSLHNPLQQLQLQQTQMNYSQNRTLLHNRSSSKTTAVPLYKFQVAQIEEHLQKRGQQQHHRKTISQNNMNIVKHITIHSVFSK